MLFLAVIQREDLGLVGYLEEDHEAVQYRSEGEILEELLMVVLSLAAVLNTHYSYAHVVLVTCT